MLGATLLEYFGFHWRLIPMMSKVSEVVHHHPTPNRRYTKRDLNLALCDKSVDSFSLKLEAVALQQTCSSWPLIALCPIGPHTTSETIVQYTQPPSTSLRSLYIIRDVRIPSLTRYQEIEYKSSVIMRVCFPSRCTTNCSNFNITTPPIQA